MRARIRMEKTSVLEEVLLQEGNNKRAYACSVCQESGHKARRVNGVAQCPRRQQAAAAAAAAAGDE